MKFTTKAMLAFALVTALAGGAYAQGGGAGGAGGAGGGAGNGVAAGGGNASGAGGMATGATGTGSGMGTGTGAAPDNPSRDRSSGMNNSTRPNTGHGTNDNADGKQQNGQ
ncbi:hypothetical protein [Paraburkholderia youngii]|uniref:hypothetical protein n=1 Tax=Paraburkholderia youngii TaxID=2782701 RepID=UPI001591A6CE|nr:hypothetical protein [Paraburkholderia youngii]NUX54635.1 hypothetical protein [Paraburkholderia youngii]